MIQIIELEFREDNWVASIHPYIDSKIIHLYADGKTRKEALETLAFKLGELYEKDKSSI